MSLFNSQLRETSE